MIRLTFPGQNVPEWLHKVEVLEGGHLGSFKFSNINLIWKRKGQFNIIGLLRRPCITLLHSENIVIRGQGAGVHFNGTLPDLVIYAIKRIMKGGAA